MGLRAEFILKERELSKLNTDRQGTEQRERLKIKGERG